MLTKMSKLEVFLDIKEVRKPEIEAIAGAGIIVDHSPLYCCSAAAAVLNTIIPFAGDDIAVFTPLIRRTLLAVGIFK